MTEPKGRGAAWTEERGTSDEGRRHREGGTGRWAGPRRRAENTEPKGGGAAWTEERGTSDEGRRHLKAPGRRAENTDTVARAGATPDMPQPFAELGLTEEEYGQILATLGRRPTSAELALYSVMWSEHCSYKSSKVHLRQFADKAPPSSALLAGIGHNAGGVDIGGG